MTEPRKEVLADGVEIWLGDCRDVLPLIGKVDAVVTDPPYGIGFEYHGYEDSEENLNLLIVSAIAHCISISSRMILFCNHRMIWKFRPADWVACVTWNTTGSYGKLGVCQWMPVLFYGKDIPGFGCVNAVLKSDVISISGGDGVGFRRMEEIDHPCPKPLNLMRRLISRHSLFGEMVADPFMGSGTTGVACVNLGRKFIGIEIEERYFSIARRRISDALKAPRLPLDEPAKVKQEALAL